MSPCTRARQASKDWYVRIVRDAGHPAWLGVGVGVRLGLGLGVGVGVRVEGSGGLADVEVGGDAVEHVEGGARDAAHVEHAWLGLGLGFRVRARVRV